MYPPSMQGPAIPRSQTINDNRRFSELYFGYASNLSPKTIKGRCPESMFCGLARLDDYRFQINETGYGNIVPSPGDIVYGSLSFLSPRDEASLDDSEGVPWMYGKHMLQAERIDDRGKSTGQVVPIMTYVDVQRTTEGTIMPDYAVWINKAIRDTKPFGLPNDYAEKYLRPYIPPMSKEEEERDLEPIRVMAPVGTRI